MTEILGLICMCGVIAFGATFYYSSALIFFLILSGSWKDAAEGVAVALGSYVPMRLFYFGLTIAATKEVKAWTVVQKLILAKGDASRK